VAETRVNLLTLHATKGLEFSRVYLIGVEDDSMPGWRALKSGSVDQFPEARRLLYVGMTRAKERLILTRVGLRRDRPTGATMLLDELGIPITATGPVGVMA
ncbi:MAG: 3'-5' exonuclease, partial [Gemmatimonadota bacterium]